MEVEKTGEGRVRQYIKYTQVYYLVLEQQEEVKMRHKDNAIFYGKSDLYGKARYVYRYGRMRCRVKMHHPGK